ncbi:MULTISPECIES: STAS domain-containing protein [Pseudomonadaceae]|uniref:STAS domain-containing protein n=1 Tax=Pseudomonadaceae TaxID=135621 RepID=UPI00187D515D|nr:MULTISPECIES: STAS domain-containing protein [Pseudomonadaceae]MBE7927851.1 STAS domain-containing protein [Pseudomonas saudiphocaensis]MCF6780731.1 STAS domain-containing protein [Stutzerimonas stutzeri]MCF6803301.1 STAS domain-containing protein [Stutzerimonas stutzeri]
MPEAHIPDESTLKLGGAFTIERAAELHALLLGELQQQTPAAICLAGISEIDCSGLQLLLALRRQLPSVQLIAPSPAVEQMLARVRLTSLLTN